MNNFILQQNIANEVKTINEIVEEVFSVKKSSIDVSFFYNEKIELTKNKEVNNNSWRLLDKKKN